MNGRTGLNLSFKNTRNAKNPHASPNDAWGFSIMSAHYGARTGSRSSHERPVQCPWWKSG